MRGLEEPLLAFKRLMSPPPSPRHVTLEVMELFDVVAENDRDNEDSVASAKGQIADNVSHVLIGMAN